METLPSVIARAAVLMVATPLMFLLFIFNLIKRLIAKPTYQIPDSATVKNGDTFVYQVPAQLAVEKTEPKEIKAANGTTVATLTTDPATNTATITITNEAYYRFMNESRTVSALFTAVWADSVAVDETVTMTLPGAGSYTLTRIVPMEDSTGYFKWGVQDKDDPSMIRWQSVG